MVIGKHIAIVDAQSSRLVSNELFQKRPVMSIQDSNLYSDDHFGSHVFGNGLYFKFILFSTHHSAALPSLMTHDFITNLSLSLSLCRPTRLRLRVRVLVWGLGVF